MQVDRPVTTRPRRRSAWSGYLYSWSMLALGSAGYLGVIALKPELITGLIPAADRGAATDLAGGHRSAADVAEEIVTLRRWVNDLQHELSATKSAVKAQADQGQTLAQRIAATEQRVPQSAPAPVRETRAEQAAVVKQVAAAAIPQPAPIPAPAHLPVPVPEAVASQAAVPAQRVKILNSPPPPPATAATPIVTGSVNPPAPAPLPQTPAAAPISTFSTPKVVTAPAGNASIEIASADSLDALREQWQALSNQNAAVLKRTAPRYKIATGAGANPFTLLAGPYANAAEAARACAALRAKGVTCRVGDYVGNGL